MIRQLLARRNRTRSGRVSIAIGLGLLALIGAACAFYPLFTSASPAELVAAPFSAPSSAHPFGTDEVGRDVLVRTLDGGRLDILVSLATVLASMVLGTVVGTIAGYSKSLVVDTVISRLIDAVIAFPFIVLILALIVVFGQERQFGPLPPGLPATVAAFILVGWVYYARLARSQTMALRNRDYIVATRVMGYSRRRTVFKHVIPQVLRVTLSYSVLDVLMFVLLLASLSFVGASVQPPNAEWGAIIYGGRAYLEDAWWITAMPGAVLILFGISLTLLADGLVARGED